MVQFFPVFVPVQSVEYRELNVYMPLHKVAPPSSGDLLSGVRMRVILIDMQILVSLHCNILQFEFSIVVVAGCRRLMPS